MRRECSSTISLSVLELEIIIGLSKLHIQLFLKISTRLYGSVKGNDLGNRER